MTVTATASVATDTPDRYAKQLASHLGRRCEVREEPDGSARVVFSSGECLLQSRDGALELHATAPDADGLDHITEVVTRHLERFGQRHELQVAWQREG